MSRRITILMPVTNELEAELSAACQECRCSPEQYAAEAVHVVLASRRATRATVAEYGARTVDAEYPVHYPQAHGELLR